MKSKRRRRDHIFFSDQYLMSRWRDKQVLGPNRSAKLAVVTGTCPVWVARGRMSVVSKSRGEEEGIGWVALQSAITSVLLSKISLCWFPVFSKGAHVFVYSKTRQIRRSGQLISIPQQWWQQWKSGMEILHLQGFLLVEVSGEFLLHGRSIFLPKVSDLRTLGGWSCSTSSVDLSQQGVAWDWVK